MAVAIREFLSGVDDGTGGGDPVTVNTGAGTAVGDLLVCIHGVDFYDNTSMTTPTPGTWTQQQFSDGGTNQVKLKVWTRAVTTGGANEVTVPNTSDASNYLALYVISGGATVEDADGTVGSVAGTSLSLPSLSGTDGGFLLCAFLTESSAVNHTPPSGMTEDVELDASTFSTMSACSLSLASTGATGTKTATSSASRKYVSAGITVEPSSSGQSIAIGQASETSTANGITPSKARAITQATETDTASAISPTSGGVLFRGDFETGDFSQWPVVQNISHNDPGDEYDSSGTHYSAYIVTGVQGSHAGRFELRDGDIPFSTTERTEVQGPLYSSGGQEGDERWYQWFTQFDSTFPADHADIGFGVVAQWHDESGGSPPVGLYCDDTNGEWGLRVNVQSSPGVFVSNDMIWSTALDNGNWHLIKMHIIWSTNSGTGLVELWHNGVKQTFTAGPGSGTQTTTIQTLTPTGGGTYFKQGYYRSADLVDTGIVYHDGFIAATSESALGGPFAVDIAQATESDTAGTVTPFKATTITQATETDTANGITPGKLVTVGQASEVDTAGTIQTGSPQSIPIGQASETDTAGQITPEMLGPWILVQPIRRYTYVIGGLRIPYRVALTVYGDDDSLTAAECPDSDLLESAEYVFYGGHEYTTEDAEFKDFWVSQGFEVENV